MDSGLNTKIGQSLKSWWNSHTVPELIAGFVSYGLPSMLVVVLLTKLLPGVIYGAPAMPSIPPHGYVAVEDRVHLHWRRGNHEGEFHIQVSMDESFKEIVFERITSKLNLVLPRLKPGMRYCWRVLNNDRSPKSCFTSSSNFVPY